MGAEETDRITPGSFRVHLWRGRGSPPRAGYVFKISTGELVRHFYSCGPLADLVHRLKGVIVNATFAYEGRRNNTQASLADNP